MRSLLTILLLAVVPSLLAAEADLLPPIVSSLEMQDPRHHDNPVRVRGILRDVFPDELNAEYAFLVIQNESGPIYASVRTAKFPLTQIRTLLNATVEASGICRPSYSYLELGRQPRLHLGRILEIRDSNGLRILKPAPDDPFDVPEILERHNLYPYQLQQLGMRKARGRVLAAWGGRTILIETSNRHMMRIELAEDAPPTVGEFVEVAGYPDTDVYRINFNRARWRKTAPWVADDEPVHETSASQVLTDGHGASKVDTTLYGKPIRLSGTIRTVPDSTRNRVFQLENDGYLLTVDASACPEAAADLSIGSVIRATGVCVLNVENWRPNDIFPQITGFTLVIRNAGDIVVLSRPSWWTARRLGVALVAVLLVLIAILVWNRSLSVLAERRGMQLAEEQLGRATSELKVLERTRFSAELHDALSQTLSGIAMQLGAIKRFAKTDPEQMLQHLDIASRTLKSCRDEMRNLLWDLRSQVLDEPDIEKALRQILEPHLEETDVRIRFAVPRARLTDSTARALFCIVRELTVNAIRHGHATAVRIAGSIENGRLYCSVRDNGCGFDPSTAPGAEEGHFGLQGIRERMDALDGTFTIESTRDRGTKVTISLATPHEEEKT